MNELPKILDGADEPVTVEELEAVVRRAGQRRRATLVAGAAALVAIGGLGGALARGSGAERTGLAAEGQAADGRAAPAAALPPKIAMGAAMGMPAPGFGEGLTFTSLFRRESHGVAIRAYEITMPEAPDGAGGACASKPDMVHAGLSNAAAVATVVVPSLRSGGAPTNQGQLKLSGAGTFGAEEGEPATWAVVEVDGTVASVRLTAGGATDTMAPKDGTAVLVVPGRTTAGTVDALGADGSVLASRSLEQPDSWMPDPACQPPPCVIGTDGPPDKVETATPTATATAAASPAQNDEPTAKPAEPAQDLPCFSKCIAVRDGSAAGKDQAVSAGGAGSSSSSGEAVCTSAVPAAPADPTTGAAPTPATATATASASPVNAAP